MFFQGRLNEPEWTSETKRRMKKFKKVYAEYGSLHLSTGLKLFLL